MAFFVRVVAGLAYGWYSKYLFDNDSWRYFNDSQEETNYLLHRPLFFLYRDIFDNNGYSGNPFTSFFFVNGHNHYFNDLRDNLVLKFEAVLNVFSYSNYFTNQLLGNFLLILALVGLLRVFRNWFCPQYIWLVVLFFLFYPPFVIWTSNIHKDMLSVLCLSGIFYGCLTLQNHLRIKRWYFFIIVCSFFLLLFMRNYMALALVFSFLAYKVASRFTRNQTKAYALIFGSAILLFALSSYFPSSINLPLLLSRKQNGFYDVGGSQPLHLLPMNGSLTGYIRNLPHAIVNTTFYPYHLPFWTSYTNMLGLLSFLTFLFLLYGAFRYPLKSLDRTIGLRKYFILGFCVLIYFVIGVTVPVYGSLLRYRVTAETFLYTILLLRIDFGRFRWYITLKKIIYLGLNKKL